MNHIIVSENCSNMRKAARQGLTSNWYTAMLATLVFAAATTLPSMLAVFIFGKDFGTIVGNIYMLITGGAFLLGFSYFTMSLFRTGKGSPKDIFYGFDYLVKAFALNFVMMVFVILWSLLLIIPGIVAAYRYRLSYYVMLDNPNLSTLEVINESKRLMRGNKGKLFLLDLSFIGWAILATITFGLGFIALTPYMNMATFVFYELCNGNIMPRNIEINYGYKNESQSLKIQDDDQEIQNPESDLNETDNENNETNKEAVETASKDSNLQ